MTNLNEFMIYVKNIKPIRDKFVSCKNLKESYDTFKIMLNGCSYEEYEKFFKDIINNSNEISDDELANVAGGTFNFKNILTPLAALTVFAGTAAGISYAYGDKPDIDNPSGNQSVITNNIENSSDDESEKIKIQDIKETNNVEIKDKPVNTEKNLENKKEKQKNKEVEEKKDKIEIKDNEEDNLEEDDLEKFNKNTDVLENQNKEDKNNTNQAEIEYSLKVIEKMPKEGEEGFDKFLELPNKNELRVNREETIKEKSGYSEKITLNEQDIYDQIQNTVNEIIEKVKQRTPGEDLTEDQIITEINNKKISKHYKLPKKLRVAKGIYRWVAKNISYDFKSLDKNEYGEDSFRKPQDAIFVYNLKLGVCEGYARLTNLMMRMAEIPSSYIVSIKGKDEDYGHAFNAIYMDDESSKKGWTLIDSTWASPLSDSFRQNENKNSYTKYMEGKFEFSMNFSNNLNRYDGYTKKLDETFKYLYYNDKIKNLKDDDIKELNKKAADKLEELNKEYTSGPKYEKIEFCLEKIEFDDINTKRIYEVMRIPLVILNVNYKTNLSEEEARKVSKKLEEDRIINTYIKMSELIEYVTPGYPIVTMENIVNKYKDNRSIYSEDLRSKVLPIVGKYKEQNNKEVIDELNKELKKALDEINKSPEYNNLNKFKSIYLKINKDPKYEYWFTSLYYETDLSLDEAKAIDDTNVNCKIKVYFPGFYDEGTLEEANKFIIEKSFHKIQSFDDEGYKFEVTADDGIRIRCYLEGHETKAHISLDNFSEKPSKNFRIPKELVNLNIPFRIGAGIESLILQGNEEIDIEFANNLESIDTTKSNKYIMDADEIRLYEKNSDGTKGRFLMMKVLGRIGEDGIKYHIFRDFDEISLFGNENAPAENLIIPKFLLDLNKKFNINSGIKSVILQGDEEINIEFAQDLMSIDVTKSSRYVLDDKDDVILLYEKNENGTKTGDFVGVIKKTIKIGDNNDVDYYIYPEKISLECNEDAPAENLIIPKFLLDLNKKFNINSGIKSVILQGDEEINIEFAQDLMSIDVTKSSRYVLDDKDDVILLYEKNENGIKTGDFVGVIKKTIKIGDNNDVDYYIYSEEISLECNEDALAENLIIPKFLLDLNKKFNINSGIKSVILQGDEEINIEFAQDLMSIDATKSNRYLMDNGSLYEKTKDGSKGKLIWSKQ